MNDIINVLEKLIPDITIISNSFLTYSIKYNNSIICSIDTMQKRYQVFDMNFNTQFEDIKRLLCNDGYFAIGEVIVKQNSQCGYFNYKDPNRFAIKRMESLIGEDIVGEYIYIGNIDIDDIDPEVPYTYIQNDQYSNAGYVFFTTEDDIGGVVVNAHSESNYESYYNYDKIPNFIDNILSHLYIGDIIPEELQLKNCNNILFGVYNGECVIWKYEMVAARKMWNHKVINTKADITSILNKASRVINSGNNKKQQVIQVNIDEDGNINL